MHAHTVCASARALAAKTPSSLTAAAQHTAPARPPGGYQGGMHATNKAMLLLALVVSQACMQLTMVTAAAMPSAARPSSVAAGTVPGLLREDPEQLFNVLARGALYDSLLASITDAVTKLPLGEDSIRTLTDGLGWLSKPNDAAYVLHFADPTTQSVNGQALLTVELTHEQAIEEISVRLNTASSNALPNFQKCLSTMFWVRRNSSSEPLDSLQFNNLRDNLQTRLARSEDFSATGNRVSWTSRGKADCKVAKVFTLVQPVSAFCEHVNGKGAAVTELQLFTQVDLQKFRSKASVWDTTFHPCANSGDCAGVSTIVQEQRRQGVAGSFLSGLQHNLAEAAAPWVTAVFGKDDQDPVYPLLDKTPFGGDDSGSLPSATAGAAPGLTDVNARLAAYSKPASSGYEGWPMWSNSLADWKTISSHYSLTGAPDLHLNIEDAAFPFLSSLRVDSTDAFNLYTECTRDKHTDMTFNEMLIRAFDTVFPHSVWGYQEYNLNNTAINKNGVKPPVLNDRWKKCMAGPLRYMADTNRPFGVHFDITPFYRSEPALVTLGSEFPDTTMIWNHGGIAPEVDHRLSAQDHIAIMSAWLESSPGKRFVDLSATSGFWLRLQPAVLGNVERVYDYATGTWSDQPRDWVADCQAYMRFFNEFQDALVFGTDQVALDHAESLSRSIDGLVIQNRPNYFQGSYTYGAILRFEIGLLYQAMQVALTHESGRSGYDSLYSPEFKLRREVIDKIFWDNAEGIMLAVHHPHAGESCDGYKHYGAKKQSGGGAGSEVSVASVAGGSKVATSSFALDPSAKAVIHKQLAALKKRASAGGKLASISSRASHSHSKASHSHSGLQPQATTSGARPARARPQHQASRAATRRQAHITSLQDPQVLQPAPAQKAGQYKAEYVPEHVLAKAHVAVPTAGPVVGTAPLPAKPEAKAAVVPVAPKQAQQEDEEMEEIEVVEEVEVEEEEEAPAPKAEPTQPAKPAPVAPARPPVEEPARKPVEQPARAPVQQPERKPAQPPVQQPAREPVQQPEHKPAQPPVQQPAREPVQQPERKPAQPPVQQPVQQPERKPAQQPVQQPERKPAQPPVQQPVQQPERKPAQPPVQQPAREPVQQRPPPPQQRPVVEQPAPQQPVQRPAPQQPAPQPPQQQRAPVDDTPHELPQDSEELLSGPTAPHANYNSPDAPEYWEDSDLDSAPAPHKPYVKAGGKHKYAQPEPAYTPNDDDPEPYKPPSKAGAKPPKYEPEEQQEEDFSAQLKPKAPPSKREEAYEEPEYEQDDPPYTPPVVPVVKPYKPKYPRHTKHAPEGDEDDASDAPHYAKKAKGGKKAKRHYEPEPEEETYHHAHHYKPHTHHACVPTGLSNGDAVAFIRTLMVIQWKELKNGAGADAPPLDEWLPPALL